jgi:predicted SprT family Zn-dependent metalloprotease
MQRQAAAAGGRTLEQQVQAYFEDIAYHELGHLYVYAYGIKAPTHWMNEFLASYLMLASLVEKHSVRVSNMQRMRE